MRFPILALFSLFWLSHAEAADPFRTSVLTYNIHHAAGVDGKLDLERIAKIIRDVKPDLVALQEVDYATDRVKDVDQATELARLTGLTVVPGDNIDYANGRYGNAALSRWPVVSHENHVLPESSAEQRGVLDIQVDPGDGNPKLRFLATHLDHRSDEAERLASAAFINKLVKEQTGPAILAGDLNMVPDSEAMNRFAVEWSNPTEGTSLPTIPVGTPRRQIDYILCRPVGKWQTIEARVLDEPVASDHRPLLIVLEWTE